MNLMPEASFPSAVCVLCPGVPATRGYPPSFVVLLLHIFPVLCLAVSLSNCPVDFFSLPNYSSVLFGILAYCCHYRLQLCNWWFSGLSHYTAPLLNVIHKGGTIWTTARPHEKMGSAKQYFKVVESLFVWTWREPNPVWKVESGLGVISG